MGCDVSADGSEGRMFGSTIGDDEEEEGRSILDDNDFQLELEDTDDSRHNRGSYF
jgi:hypothetical protein